MNWYSFTWQGLVSTTLCPDIPKSAYFLNVLDDCFFFHQKILASLDGKCIFQDDNACIQKVQIVKEWLMEHEIIFPHGLATKESKLWHHQESLGRAGEIFTQQRNSSIINTRWWLDRVWQQESSGASQRSREMEKVRRWDRKNLFFLTTCFVTCLCVLEWIELYYVKIG